MTNVFKQFFDKRKEKQELAKQEQKELDELKKEVRVEMRDEIKNIMKQKIKEEEINKVSESLKPKDKFAGLKKLADEFKSTNIGGTEQMERMLGKEPYPTKVKGIKGGINEDRMAHMLGRSTSNQKDYGALMGGNSIRTNRDIAGDLGRDRKLRSDYKDMIGKVEDPEEKVKRLVGMKRK